MSVQMLDHDAYASLPPEMFVIGIDESHAEDIPRPSTTYWHDVWQRFRRDRLALIGLAVIVIMGLIPAILGLVAYLILRHYPVTDEVRAEMVKALSKSEAKTEA